MSRSTMLSRYTDFARLGQGGMGIVYRATDTQLHRSVALKFVTAQFESEDQARSRFLREARMAAALNHPAICTIAEPAFAVQIETEKNQCLRFLDQ